MLKHNPIYMPNYQNSILSVMASISRYYGVISTDKTCSELDVKLSENYRNVVVLIADGMGVSVLENALDEQAFLCKHTIKSICSVFPSTTVPATATFYSGVAPIVHGRLGWGTYFKETNEIVETFTGKNMYTQEPSDIHPNEVLAYERLIDKIKAVNSNIECTELYPDKIDNKNIHTFHQMTRAILAETQKPNNHFIIAYWHNPDYISHRKGPYSAETIEVVREINAQTETLAKELQDTLLIVLADHGHIDIQKYISINDCGLIDTCLRLPLSIEDRCSAVFVHPDKKELFEAEFQKYLADDFLLFSDKEVMDLELLGPGIPHARIHEFIGDYLLIGKTDKCLYHEVSNGFPIPFLKGHHGGVTQNEMLVPLILIGKK